ncbi:hypothetical protein ACFTZB_07650 [Rhodococcus sp. NPDC057014]|uniref:hypothetical protein n=1 Tax=Rhodococcus sp. NPDC057014 TaxID=3346000 RepID=UPI003629CF6C
MATHYLQDLTDEDIVLEALPDDVLASMESRDRWTTSLPHADGGLEYLVADLQSWTPGQTVRVAFLGGSDELYSEIEEATRPISEAANLVLDFKEARSYRVWSPQDAEYAAEIRVSFDAGGYFSLVGTDSVNPNIGLPHQPVGGLPYQRSLNLGGFHVTRPATWKGTTRHEFLHALGVHHEHQNMRGPCQVAFRWDDDPGYQPTRDQRGAFVTDINGLRPGIYTYLSGYPNGWSRAKVDHNLRAPSDGQSLISGPFDGSSVMLYRFPPLFYRSHPSPCAPRGDGQEISEGDERGLEVLYPKDEEQLDVIGQRREKLLETIEPALDTDEGLESAGPGLPEIARDAAQRLRASVLQLKR